MGVHTGSSQTVSRPLSEVESWHRQARVLEEEEAPQLQTQLFDLVGVSCSLTA
jgi:hypothetical protein